MSSSMPIDSLSGLAALLLEVDTFLKRGLPWDLQSFSHMRTTLNELQVRCGNHDGVVNARVEWYEAGVENFERFAVELAESGQWPFSLYNCAQPEHGLFAGTATLEHFLRRHYLKSGFARMYRRLYSCYERIRRAPALEGGEVNDCFALMSQKLEERLMEGGM